ncbi:MAG: UDP-N-acetylmuramoyl-L-alanyl-D-glutamate--2,6-diaminopimelate ligase [Actinobacteria bacterium]|jgi:UDP-N-acetylmuramoyl-L-alanyl-D-glutamate--2,6-diaminopimelate ligase|nr:UDP-N-acetylmuramoyl-L-alanyl-D-glutamate--2,6-diaminopimelate ligase [Actinomycetota bacterium]MCL5445050.1 UDP-N-acetylmuramoyl-L-alanyl-D-glutamate--2,6-diaminopimelate ligase [Actinomycetota bacterium]
MSELLDCVEVIEVVGDPGSVDARAIEYDSRQVGPGDIFCCLPGVVEDGHRYALEAVSKGAVGVVCERFVDGLRTVGAPVARVREGTSRVVMAQLAAAINGYPSNELFMIGITGTNGKTTVANLLGTVLSSSGRPTQVMGTLSSTRTTPESPELQESLAAVVESQRLDGKRHVVAMEVSSHALAQSRVAGIRFDLAVFTNLSHDHLDYHATMERYFEAKAMLFGPDQAAKGVVNKDDEWGKKLLEVARIPVVAVGSDSVSDVELSLGHTKFKWRGLSVETSLTGMVNVHNCLLVAETALAAGLAPEEVCEGLSKVSPVPGRMQVLSGWSEPGAKEKGVRSQPFSVIVDYAHTPAGLCRVLDEARRLVRGDGKVVVVFGCGGNRDRAKRPMMGHVAARGADICYLTSDNPREEDPLEIVREVLSGVGGEVPDGGSFQVELDRRSAIAGALKDAHYGDVVVVAGKGHESTQVLKSGPVAFDDRLVSLQELSRLGFEVAGDV